MPRVFVAGLVLAGLLMFISALNIGILIGMELNHAREAAPCPRSQSE